MYCSVTHLSLKIIKWNSPTKFRRMTPVGRYLGSGNLLRNPYLSEQDLNESVFLWGLPENLPYLQ